MGEPSDTPTATQLPSPPRHRNGEPRRPPELVSHPMHRARPRPPAGSVPHQFPQPGLLGSRLPATISFTSPKLSRKPSPPEALPRPPYAATARRTGTAPQVIQAPMATRHRNGEPGWPPELVSHPMHRARPRRPAGGVPHQFPQPGRPGSGLPATISFTSPSSAENRHRQEPSRGQLTRPPLRAGTATSSDTSRFTARDEREPTVSCASTSRKAQTCRAGTPKTSKPLPVPPQGRGRSSDGGHRPRSSTSTYAPCQQRELLRSTEPGQYTSVRHGERIADNNLVASVGSNGDCFALAESLNGLCKWELIYPQGSLATDPAWTDGLVVVITPCGRSRNRWG